MLSPLPSRYLVDKNCCQLQVNVSWLEITLQSSTKLEGMQQLY